MSYADVKSAVDTGQGIVIGIIIIATVLAIGLYIVDQLDKATAYTSGNTTVHPLAPAVELINNAVNPISGGLQFLALAFLVLVAVIIIRILQSVRGGGTA